MSSTVDQIKARLRVEEVIGVYVKLEKSGVNFKAPCPFHHEKTPSFIVSPVRQSYYCFGCNRGGDMFSFIQEIEGADFKTALQTLADRAGVILHHTNDHTSDELTRMREIMEVATLLYQQELQQQPDVVAYVTARGVSKMTSEEFRVGFAPDNWRTCSDYLIMKGYTKDEIMKSGLAVEGKHGSIYDRFRSRIMFPIADTSGRVVAFSGRIFEGGTPTQTVGDITTQGKYVNSPQTILYNKSNILYGYDKAKFDIRKKDRCILVEGQFDLILSHQAGVKECVAVSGTALTTAHLEQIKRITLNSILAFDADSAGIASTKRAVRLGLSLGLNIYALPITGGKDPADIVRDNPLRWSELVAEPQHFIDYYLEKIVTQFSKHPDERLLRHTIEVELIPLLAEIGGVIDQAHFVRRTSDVSRLPEAVIWKSLTSYQSNQKTQKDKAFNARSPENSAPGRETHPQQIVPLTRIEVTMRRLFGILWWQQTVEQPQIDVTELERTVHDTFPTLSREHEERLLPLKSSILFEAELAYYGHTALSIQIESLFQVIQSESLKVRYTELLRELSLVVPHDDERTKSILTECQEIGHQLESLKKSGVY